MPCVLRSASSSVSVCSNGARAVRRRSASMKGRRAIACAAAEREREREREKEGERRAERGVSDDDALLWALWLMRMRAWLLSADAIYTCHWNFLPLRSLAKSIG